MSFKTKLNTITQAVHTSKFRVGQKAPAILTLAGVGALIVASVLTAKATPQMQDVVKEFKDDMAEVDTYVERTNPVDPMIVTTRRTEATTNLVISTVKVYAKPIGLIVLGTASVLYAHKMLDKRAAGLLAAYGALEQIHEAYRERVRESFGEEAEGDLNHGMTLRDHKFDKKTEKIKYEPELHENYRNKHYFRDFDGTNKHWNMSRPEWNLVFLRGQERYANDRLRSRGHLFLNDVLESLGYPQTKAGAVTGWTTGGPDGYVDFGLFEAGSAEEQDYFYFFNGETPILLDFNVQGVILDLI